MTVTRTFTVITVLSLILASGAGARLEGQMGGLGLEVFGDKNFKGRSATFRMSTPDLRPSGMDALISSFRVAAGEVWEMCTEPNYQGRCQVFSGNESDLSKRLGWNDAIASVRRIRGSNDNGNGRNGGGGNGGSATGNLELFAGTRYSGQRVIVDRAESNLRRVNFNDRASSLRVPRGEAWEVCVNADFDDCRVVENDVPDLGPIGLNREISSARPRPLGFGRGGGPTANRPRVVLYDGRNYQGRATTIDDDTPSLRWTTNTAGSVRVLFGRWQLCEDAQYGGRCVNVTQDVPDLERFGMGNRISSVRQR
jgi:Beta/Gamma crystallin